MENVLNNLLDATDLAGGKYGTTDQIDILKAMVRTLWLNATDEQRKHLVQSEDVVELINDVVDDKFTVASLIEDISPVIKSPRPRM